MAISVSYPLFNWLPTLFTAPIVHMSVLLILARYFFFGLDSWHVICRPKKKSPNITWDINAKAVFQGWCGHEINKSNLTLRTFSVRAILILKVKNVLILTVIYYINHQLVIGDLVLKVKQVLILTVLKTGFDCIFEVPFWCIQKLVEPFFTG